MCLLLTRYGFLLSRKMETVGEMSGEPLSRGHHCAFIFTALLTGQFYCLA